MGDRPCQSQVKAKESYPVSPREHGVQLEGGGAGSPTAGSCGTPSLLALPPGAPSHTLQLPTYVGLAPVHRFWSSGCCLPWLCLGHPPPTLLLFIRAVEKDFLFLEPNLLLHTAPMPQPHAVVPSWGAWVEQKGVSLP